VPRDPLRDVGVQADDYRRYDRYADVVACFEFLARVVTAIKQDVSHFDRFPKVAHPSPSGMGHLTPDFLWAGTGRALLGEICTVAAQPHSGDSARSQVAHYMTATHRMDGNGVRIPLGEIETVVLTPHASAATAEEAILADPTLRELAKETGVRPPVVISFSADSGTYCFARSAHVDNGVPDLFPGLGRALGGLTINLDPEKFTPYKVEGPFINDPIPPLYLASYLIARGFVGKGIGAVGVDGVAARLLEQYGRGSRDDVRKALDLLVAAEVLRATDYDYEHRRALPQSQETQDALIARMHDVSAKEAEREQKTKERPSRREKIGPEGQEVLF